MHTENNVYVEKIVYENFSMGKRDNAFSLILALLSIPFVSLSLWGGLNIGYTVSFLLFTLLFSIYLFKKEVKFKVFPYLCLILSFGASLIFTYSADNAVRFFLFLLLNLMLFIWISYLGGYDLSDDYSLISALTGGISGTLFGNITRSVKSVCSAKNEGKKGFVKVLAGVLCAIPAIVVLVLLLRSSDAAFDGMLTKIGKYIGNFNSLIFKIIVGILFFILALSLGLGIKKNKSEQRTFKINSHIDKVFVISFLSAIAVVYLAYIFSQFAYFFNAFKGLLPEGYSASAYARRGFFEMTVIAAINFVIISLSSVLTKKNENGKRATCVNVVIVFIAVFTLLLIATALSKMILYIKIFGMTRLRILTSTFMVFLAILFIAVILRVFIKKIPVIKVGIIVATVLLLVIGFADVDKVVAKYNLYAFEQRYIENLDVDAIGDLGYGAVSTLYEIHTNHDYPNRIRDAAGEYLKNKAYDLYNVKTINGTKEYERKTEAGGFNVSEYKARKILEEFLKI